MRENYAARARTKLRRGAVYILDRWGPTAHAMVVLGASLFVSVLFVGVLRVFGVYTPSATELIGLGVKTLVPVAVATVTAYFMSRLNRQVSILIEVTLSYLTHSGKGLLDDVLRRMISGRWNRQELKPGEALFSVLKQICSGDDWELKRLLSEALPALSQIDPHKTHGILSLLRDDWEPARWESDLRRRAVEALVTPFRGSVPLLFQLSTPQLRSLLRIRDRDQVYTAMAIIEVLDQWEKTEPDIAAVLATDTIEFAKLHYLKAEEDSLHTLRELLQLVGESSIDAAADQLTRMSESTNVFTRIAAARNVWRLDGRRTGTMLDLMLRLSSSTEDKNVRRPIAKERSMDCILREAVGQAYRAKADLIFDGLISDPDEIIRVTTFDKAEVLRGSRNDLLESICRSISQNETSAILRQRAERVLSELTAGVTSEQQLVGVGIDE